MEIEIGYFPRYYYSPQPNAGGHFPFAIDGELPLYVFSMDGFYLPDCNEDFVPLWMENIKAFPVYFCAEIPSYWKEEYEELCGKCNIKYKYLSNNSRFSVSVTEIIDINQFREIFPIFISIGSSNDLVIWSTNKDFFRVEEREWKGNWEGKIGEVVVVKIGKEKSVFWIGYDGHSIVALSDNTDFSTYETICETLPPFVKPTKCEYE
ncbi:hypothetical protein BAOM_0929 [Peribacillus asahii]|uniref:Uncharacterized protein n=1 Tax=Peribacillus asahii TaxID=228899 RepID=A0A3T0KM99_9BACI|nr:hypothetical protein [Peribacillus asahii]AZV41540.1 hypothetical protein BAOM_0929 [Peribacillus asahii]